MEQNLSTLERLQRSTKSFIKMASNGGMMLMIVGIIALVWANSPLQEWYEWLFEHFDIRVAVNEFSIDMHFIHWINDALMAIFFLMVGLEIKREIYAGELSNFKVAALPIFAAAGGMLVPMCIYKMFGFEGELARGWGIPMATDIAFSIGILTLLGKRVPLVLKVFLTALAIVDDLGAVLVIAIFYTTELNLTCLGIGLGLVALLLVLNLMHCEFPPIYMIIGAVVWYMFLKSGIHATFAGVLVAFTIPMRQRMPVDKFVDGVTELLPNIGEPKRGKNNSVVLDEKQLHAVETIAKMSGDIKSPLQILETMLHRFVNFFVLPLFALANSGIIFYHFKGANDVELFSTVTVAVALSLFVGKTIGISLFSWIACKMGLAAKPARSSWTTFVGLGMMGGIGFTMSLFITTLAFHDPAVLSQAKLGIYIGSILAGVCGYHFLKWSLARDEQKYGKYEE